MKINVLILLSLLFPFFSSAQNMKKIDEIFADYANENPGAIIAIVKDGQLVFKKAYGLSNLEDKTKVQANTNFRLASVSKQFTAAAILQLIQQGKIDLNTSLNKCFPNLPDYSKSITIQQLLNHTSGILDYDDVIDEADNFEQISDQGVLDLAKTFTKTYFIPGTKYKYSNTAYVLLGLVIEKYSGLSYANYMEKFIFNPLKMNNSVAYLKNINQISHRAYGYSKENNSWFRKDQSSTSATLGDGGIYSNLNDLIKWNEALNNDTILPQKIWKQAFDYQHLSDGTPIDYGFGWHLKKDKNNTQIVYHTGSTTSFRNIFYRIPAEKLSLIILSNRNKPAENNMVQLAEQFLQAYKEK